MNLFSNKKLLKTGAKYSLISTISSIISMLIGIVMMLWLMPEEIGKWNAVSMFLAYLPFLQLGVQSGLSVELPIKIGENDDEKIRSYIANGYSFAIFISIVIAIIGIILAIVYYFNHGLDLALGIITIAISGICQSFSLHFTARFRSAKAFDDLSKVIAMTIPITLSSIFFIYKYHYYGILIYNSVPSIISVILRYLYLPYKDVKPSVKWYDFKTLLKVGIALLIPNNLHSASQTLPRWIILNKSGVRTLGLYSPALAVNSLISLLPAQIAQFFHPQMGYIYGKTGKAREMWPYVKKMNIYMPLVSVAVAAVIWLMAPWVLKVFAPQYIESLWAMRIMCIAFVFTSSFTTLVVFFTIHAYIYAYIVTVFDFVGCFVFPYVMTLLIPEHILTAVTIGMVINNFLVYVLNFILLRVALFDNKYN